MKIKILLTFDYELPLGGVKSYSKGLFEPAEKLIDTAKELNIPIVFFADVCSASKFKSWDIEFYNKFKSQIHKAITEKNDVQLHIHPHWIDSEYKNGKFIPSKNFSLSNFKANSEFNIETIIKQSYNELVLICKEADPNYKCVAYRAGGYNIEPESEIILSTLYELGIKYDSSVIKGLYHNYSFSKIDYRNAPKKNNWKISIKGPLTKETIYPEYLTELPVTSKPNSFSNIIRRRIKKTLHKSILSERRYKNTGKGYSAVSVKTKLTDKIKMMKNPVVLSFDFEHYDLKDLERIVTYNISKHKKEDEIYITLISHPKSMGYYHLNLMKNFVELMKRKYQDKASFLTYQTINNND